MSVLDTWTPLSVLIVGGGMLYIACQGAVMIINALRGNNQQPTALEQQISQLIALLSAFHAVQITHDLARTNSQHDNDNVTRQSQ